MKKHFKHDSPSVPPQVEPDVVALINAMQQQLVSLEGKIDTLVSQSSERPFEKKHFSKPSRPFDRSYRHGKGRQDNSYRERNFTQAICADCKKECEVPFKPSADRPVYCRECFSKRNEGGSFKGKYDNRPREGDFAQGRHFYKQLGGGNRRSGKSKKPVFRRRNTNP
ncbi:MAG: CxxC-x17-CxxC domain-containing protein [Candidatus Omnitrophota bacterium]